ncbi:hypothetical protein DESC_610313 [Desulfosarcina cetonica]|nr:hypothetical protein DESC_610313 [Desulfosarcina cetonica]
MAGRTLRQLGGDVVAQIDGDHGFGHQGLVTTKAFPLEIFGFDMIDSHFSRSSC